jgi:lysozyme
MEISENGLAMIRYWEGCELEAYQDGGGVWTIGYGHTAGVREGDVWTQEQADDALAGDAVSIAQDPVNTLVTVPLSQNQFDSLGDFTYNLGEGNLSESTLLAMLNAGDYAGAQAQFPRWNQIAGQPSQGLTNRRNAEANLFGTPDGDTAAATAAITDTNAPPAAIATAPPAEATGKHRERGERKNAD